MKFVMMLLLFSCSIGSGTPSVEKDSVNCEQPSANYCLRYKYEFKCVIFRYPWETNTTIGYYETSAEAEAACDKYSSKN